jgi:hypothetical protein
MNDQLKADLLATAKSLELLYGMKNTAKLLEEAANKL